jgi:hypothetical protein
VWNDFVDVKLATLVVPVNVKFETGWQTSLGIHYFPPRAFQRIPCLWPVNYKEVTWLYDLYLQFSGHRLRWKWGDRRWSRVNDLVNMELVRSILSVYVKLDSCRITQRVKDFPP